MTVVEMHEIEIPHPYICECQNERCQRQVLLLRSEWVPMSERGNVIHFDCLDAMTREKGTFVVHVDNALRVAVVRGEAFVS